MASGSSSRAADVQVALQRARRKLGHLQLQLLHKETNSEDPVEVRPWTPSQELRDSLVDMYKANPEVNLELRQRLPSPAGLPRSPDRFRASLNLDQPILTQAPQQIHESLRKSTGPPEGTAEMEVEPPASQGPSPCVGSDGNGPPGSSIHGHLLVSEDSRQDMVVGLTSGVDKKVFVLLHELDVLRAANQRLQDQLIHQEAELQRMKAEFQLREERSGGSWERPAAILEEVLAAQKDRDQALMSRLLLANEERDEALLRVQRLKEAAELDSLVLGDSDQDVDELLQCVCGTDSVQEVEKFGAVLVQRLELANQRRNDITAQEMKAVMEERDLSVAKCKRLEHELMQEREHRVTKEELLRLQRELEAAVDDKQCLEAELKALQANHSCRPSVTTDSSSVGVGQQALPTLASPLQVQLEQLSNEKRNMEVELQRCQEGEREAGERIRRLERLVDVLRKKVGTGSLRAVV